jgi:hypothetical protein
MPPMSGGQVRGTMLRLGGIYAELHRIQYESAVSVAAAQ